MAQHKRTSVSITNKKNVGTGVYLAKIISHLDPTFNGSLEVTLLREQSNIIGDDTQTYVVRCATPFFGYTAYEFMGQNDGSKSTAEGFNDTQKSYGMWMVPPDVGVTVLVTFVNGDPSQGYWIGCVPSKFTNHMVPAIAGSTLVDLDPEDKKKYNTQQPLPVAEVNRRLNAKKDQQVNVDKIKKPLHPIAENFLVQGLIEDDVRGTTTSSARREAPSMVFGISSPGPLDKRPGAKRAKIGINEKQTIGTVPVSRLGGTTFVMDDGDDRFVREKPASEGPVKYMDVLAGEKGDVNIPYNEYFRIRTRTGHQLLMHNSEDIIYIGNARGTTWIEMTSNGKIDIYAKDSVSIHTENDLNIKADRDINMEAGRNINLKAEAGRMRVEVAKNYEVLVGESGLITVGKDYEHVIAGNTKFTTTGNLDVKTEGNQNLQAGADANLKVGGRYKETATRIDMNGPIAAPATAAKPIEAIPTHDNPLTRIEKGWNPSKYQDGTVKSILKRIPMHEPWLLHENQAPDQLTPDKTDRET